MTSEEILAKFDLKVGKSPLIEIPDARREDLARWFYEWGFTRGVEVGTCEGYYAETLLSSNPNLALTCVDPWKVYPGYKDYARQSTLDKAKEMAEQRLSKFYGRCYFAIKFSEDAAKEVPDESLDFVYIDANHELIPVLKDIYAWVPKVKKGGIIAGHDYVSRRDWPQVQVVEAVHAYTAANKIKPWFVLGYRTKGRHDKCRSWMWVN